MRSGGAIWWFAEAMLFLHSLMSNQHWPERRGARKVRGFSDSAQGA